MEGNRGVALILALLVLSFLTILGGALLTTSTVDIWISDNFRTASQTLYLAEAGIDHARELLRTSSRPPSELLSVAAGPDHQISTADDQPIIDSRTLIDDSGRASGSYEVWLRNDHSEGMTSIVDANEVLTLVSIGGIGVARKTIEATVRKGGFPDTDMDPRLKSAKGLEALVRSIMNNASDVHVEPRMGDFGGPDNYRVVAVDGSLELGPGTGYGILLVRGDLDVVGDITWNGLIIVVGRGVVRWNGSAIIYGGMFVARTLATDSSILEAPEDVSFNITDPTRIKAANRSFPYSPIAMKER